MMPTFKKAISSLTLLSIPIAGYCTNDGAWNGPGASWSDPANWILSNPPNVPGTSGGLDTAAFTTHAPTTITQDYVGISLGFINFNNAGTSYTINGPQSINFGIGTGPVSSSHINVTGGTETILAPIVVQNTTMSLNISGSGSLVLGDVGIANLGTIRFQNLSPSSQVSIQTLTFNEFSTSGSFTFNVGNASSITATTGNNVTVANPVSMGNGGTLTISNTGLVDGTPLAATANNFTFSSDLTLGAGSQMTILNIGGISSGAQLAVGNNVTVNGTLTMTGGALDINNLAAISGSPSTGNKVGANTANISGGTVTINNSGAVTNAANRGNDVIIPTLNISGTGTVFNTANQGGFTPGFGNLLETFNTTITGPDATLWNDDTVLVIGSINVAGGNLKGTGAFTFAGTVINSGTVYPISVDGNLGPMSIPNYTQSSSGTFEVGLSDLSTFSQIGATNATLDGTLLVDFLSDNTVSINDTYVILASTGTLSGTFSSVESTGSSSLVPHVTYDPILKEVILSFTAGMGSPGALNPSYAGSFLQPVIISLNSMNSHLILQMEQLRRRFETETPVAARSMTAKQASFQRPQGNIPVQLVALKNNQNPLLAAGPVQEKQEQLRREVSKGEKQKPLNVYMGPLGRTGEVEAKEGAPEMDFWSAGALAGIDYAFEHVGCGVSGSYEHFDMHVHDSWGKITVNEAQVSAYSTYAPKQLPALAVNGIVGGSYEWYNFRRNAGTPSDERRAKARPEGYSLDALLGVEYALRKNRFRKIPEHLEIIPLASLQYIFVHVNEYKEHGAGAFNMKVHQHHVKSLRSALGMRVNYTIERRNFSFIPEIYAEWQREYLNRDKSIKFAPVTASTAVASSSLIMPGTGRNIAVGGIDLLLTFYGRYGIEANYEYEWNSLYHDHFFYLGANLRF